MDIRKTLVSCLGDHGVAMAVHENNGPAHTTPDVSAVQSMKSLSEIGASPSGSEHHDATADYRGAAGSHSRAARRRPRPTARADAGARPFSSLAPPDRLRKHTLERVKIRKELEFSWCSQNSGRRAKI